MGISRSGLSIWWQGVLVFAAGGCICLLLFLSFRYVDSKKSEPQTATPALHVAPTQTPTTSAQLANQPEMAILSKHVSKHPSSSVHAPVTRPDYISQHEAEWAQPIPQNPAPTTQVEPPSLPAPPHISFTQARGVSTNPAFPYALQVTIQSDQQVPVAFAVNCTGAVGDVKAILIGQGAYMSVMLGTNGNAALVKFGYPPLTPQSPLVITIFSKDDIRAIAVRAL
jgi:hypothetical protein